MKITFFGAVEEVTGSRYLIETEDIKMLVDCGLFQGDKATTARNWDTFPIDPHSIDAVIVTHAHIDHTGYIPVLVKNGFMGKVYCSKGTFALSAILLVDSGNIMEERAKKSHKDSSPKPPLYTAQEALASLSSFEVVDYNTVFNIGKSLKVTLIRSGHILGSSFAIVSDGKQTVTFSGDLGRPDDLIMKAPTHLKQTDFLVLESTYGNRIHEQGDPIKMLGEIIQETVKKGGVIIIPAFAVGRTQLILYCLYQLKEKNAIPNIPIFLDSPMAIKVTDLYCNFNDEHTISPSHCNAIFHVATYTPSVEESKQIDRINGSAIIVAGSGMADGGRMLHHFQHRISDAKNTIVFVGYQAVGTEGRALVDGAKELEIFGKLYEVHAQIKTIGSLSAHADSDEILEWLGYFESSPKKVFITHGEVESAQSLKKKIEDRFGWSVLIPKYLDSFDLD